MNCMTLTAKSPSIATVGAPTESSNETATYVQSVEKVKNHIISEAIGNPHVKSSLIADPVLTVASFVNRSNEAVCDVPADFAVKVILENSGKVNLVIPAPDNLYPTSSGRADLITEILNDASGNPALRRALRENPREALNQELNRRSSGSSQISDDVEVELHEPRPGEVIIELPAAIIDRAPFMEVMAGAFDLQPFSVVAGTTGNECSYGSQVHTWCGYCGKSTSKQECNP